MLGTCDKFVVSEGEKGPVICEGWIRWNGRVRYRWVGRTCVTCRRSADDDVFSARQSTITSGWNIFPYVSD